MQSIRVDLPRVTVWTLPLVAGWRNWGRGGEGELDTAGQPSLTLSLSGVGLLNSSQKFLLNPG